MAQDVAASRVEDPRVERGEVRLDADLTVDEELAAASLWKVLPPTVEAAVAVPTATAEHPVHLGARGRDNVGPRTLLLAVVASTDDARSVLPPVARWHRDADLTEIGVDAVELGFQAPRLAGRVVAKDVPGLVLEDEAAAARLVLEGRVLEGVDEGGRRAQAGLTRVGQQVGAGGGPHLLDEAEVEELVDDAEDAVVAVGETLVAALVRIERAAARVADPGPLPGRRVSRDADGGQDRATGEVALPIGDGGDAGGGEDALGHSPVEIEGAIPPSPVVVHVGQLACRGSSRAPLRREYIMLLASLACVQGDIRCAAASNIEIT